MTAHEPETRFACALYEQLRGAAGNLFLSPASIRVAMALIYEGARGATADEMRAALGFDTPAETNASFARTLRALALLGTDTTPPDAPLWLRAHAAHATIILRIANGLWAARGHAPLEPFARAAADSYSARVEQLDFSDDTEGSRARINGWVEDATEHKIVNLVAPGQLDAATKLVVANAAYFKATWTQPFHEDATRPGPFLAPQGVVTAQLMEQTVHHGYGELTGAQVVELGYGRGDMVMRIAVPRDPGGLRALEASAVALLSASLREAKVHLVLPRFRVESRFLAASPLAALGMRSLFSYPEADLSGIDGTRELYVSSVVHQAFVATDEHGTEAAAATVMVMRAGALPRPEPIVEVRVDRPFLFWIVHPSTGTVLFCGRVLDPS